MYMYEVLAVTGRVCCFNWPGMVTNGAAARRAAPAAPAAVPDAAGGPPRGSLVPGSAGRAACTALRPPRCRPYSRRVIAITRLMRPRPAAARSRTVRVRVTHLCATDARCPLPPAGPTGASPGAAAPAGRHFVTSGSRPSGGRCRTRPRAFHLQIGIGQSGARRCCSGSAEPSWVPPASGSAAGRAAAWWSVLAPVVHRGACAARLHVGCERALNAPVRQAQHGSRLTHFGAKGGSGCALAGLSVWRGAATGAPADLPAAWPPVRLHVGADLSVLLPAGIGAARRPIFKLRRVLAGSDAQVQCPTVRRAG